MGRFILEKHHFNVPPGIRYSLLQTYIFMNLAKNIFDEKADIEGIMPKYMPVGDDAWKSDEDFEKRLVFLVQTLYNSLKQEGKISD